MYLLQILIDVYPFISLFCSYRFFVRINWTMPMRVRVVKTFRGVRVPPKVTWIMNMNTEITGAEKKYRASFNALKQLAF